MKLSCLQENLSKGLGIVGRAVATRTTLPITNNILLATDQGRLKLVATNLEIAIVSWIGAKVEKEGTITIPARLFTEYVNSLKNDKIELSLPGSSKSVHIKCLKSEAHISGLDAEDFPPIPEVGDGVTTVIDAGDLSKAIAHVAFTAATEDTRPVLTGVNAGFKGDKLTLAAADGFRLAVYNCNLGKAVEEEISVIIPARTLNELNRLIAEQEEPVEVTINQGKSQILFKLQSAQLVSQLIQGAFPNYSQLIPQKFDTRTVVDRIEFLGAVKTASIFARDGSGIVRIQISEGADLTPGKIMVSARAEEMGDNTGELDAVVAGQETKIAFNGKFLQEVLGVLSTAQVAIETTTGSSPGVIRPIGDDRYIHVVMPMFVQW
ncbi:MAG: DNA polymerase III subunit beta [Dehalococcoidia bacterium]|nr:DNA polymerase III subunit beta [Dehalococcoidia bacterium]